MHSFVHVWSIMDPNSCFFSILCRTLGPTLQGEPITAHNKHAGFFTQPGPGSECLLLLGPLPGSEGGRKSQECEDIFMFPTFDCS